jgi:hypothetical protein
MKASESLGSEAFILSMTICPGELGRAIWLLTPPFQVGIGEEVGVETGFFRSVASLLLEVLKTSILLETKSSLSSNVFFYEA